MTKTKNKGFSLVELLIAVAILSIIMVMISGFLSSTLIAQKRTKKNMQMQTEAQRIYAQLSEVIMQATYVRVQTEDNKVYEYNTSEKKFEQNASASLLSNMLVPDNYANYQLDDGTNARKVIINYKTGEIYNEKDKKYPDAGKEIDSTDTSVISFRSLTKKDDELSKSASGKITNSVYKEHYYVVPKYIYVEYSCASDKKAFVIFRYGIPEGEDEKSSEYSKLKHRLYMYRSGELDKSSVPSKGESLSESSGAGIHFSTAKNFIDEMAKNKNEEGLVSKYIENFYLTANPDENAMTFYLLVEDERLKGYNYTLNETVNIRNSNVLTVKPQLLKEWTGSTP